MLDYVREIYFEGLQKSFFVSICYIVTQLLSIIVLKVIHDGINRLLIPFGVWIPPRLTRIELLDSSILNHYSQALLAEVGVATLLYFLSWISFLLMPFKLISDIFLLVRHIEDSEFRSFRKRILDSSPTTKIDLQRILLSEISEVAPELTIERSAAKKIFSKEDYKKYSWV